MQSPSNPMAGFPPPAAARAGGWMSRAEVTAAGLDCLTGTLTQWRSRCPLLDGGKLRSKLAPDNARHQLYWRKDIEQIISLRRPLPEEFEADGHHWIWAQLLPVRFG